MQISRTVMIAALIGAAAMAPTDSASARNRAGAVVAAGVAGLAVGALIASQSNRRSYSNGYYAPYSYAPYSYAPAPTYYYAPPPPPYYGRQAYSDPIAYCMSRFRSYDPYSMTYVGYDGRRHPCP